ncbi:endoglucanase [Clostridium acetobutylicum]|nr:endoglucanase [Clostridium acetobutylicum]
MKRNKILVSALAIAFSSMVLTPVSGLKVFADTADVNVNIDTSAEKQAISPYIYGTNQDFSNAKVTARRIGGNRSTGYNWENNDSNAGTDWKNESDNYWLTLYDVPKEKYNEPASVYTAFHDKSLAMGVPYSLVTLQAGGYVAADQSGPLANTDVAPSSKWKKVEFNKNGPLSLTPDTTDDSVYMDEFVNYLVNKYGSASGSKGIKGYSLDNEPSLWPSTHPLIHPDKTKCSEVLDKDTQLAQVVKKIDPAAETFGPALFGFSAFNDFNSSPDWSSVKGNYQWFIDYYLDNMKKNSDAAGKRLLDALDLHWYPEAKGGGQRVTTSDTSNVDCNKARMQAPRSLWDSTYTEDSWIGQWCKWGLPLIPKVKSSIDKYYPGTKLSFSEYNYGGEDHISGGIAQADALGVFGKYGVYFATYWECNSDKNNYVQSAFNLYNNYDGNNSKYGDTDVKCDTSDINNSSTYASVTSNDGNKMDIIVMNKNYTDSINFNFNVSSNKNYTSGQVWGFDSNSSNITKRDDVSSISGNKFTYKIPALTAVHIVLTTAQKSSVKGDVNGDGVVNGRDLMELRKYLAGSTSNIDLNAADLNNDGAVNGRDLLELIKLVSQK